MTEKNRIRVLNVLGFLGACAGISLTRSCLERRTICTERKEISAPMLGDGFDGYTFAVLADLHGNRFGKKQEQLIRAILREKPDAVLMAGDMITSKKREGGKVSGADALAPILTALKENHIPIYYGIGNHEGRMKNRKQFVNWLQSFGVRYLSGDSVTIPGKNPDDGSITITGLELPQKYYLKKGKPLPFSVGELSELLPRKRDGFQILLSHSPLYVRTYSEWGADLSVCGHFHGGTIRLPFLGGLMTPQFQFFFPYTRGLYELRRKDGTMGYAAVSGGLGTHTINARLNNPSHLMILKLNTKGD